MTNKYFEETEWMDRYVKRPTFCPFCETDHETAFGPITSDDSVPFDFAWRIAECTACKNTWKEIYSLTAIEEISDTYAS